MANSVTLSSANLLTDDGRQLASAHRAALAPQLLTLLKQDQRRDTPDPIGVCSLWIFVHVHFQHPQPVPVHVSQLFQFRCHDFTGAAPLGKKIDQYRGVSVDDFLEAAHCLLVLTGQVLIPTSA